MLKGLTEIIVEKTKHAAQMSLTSIVTSLHTKVNRSIMEVFASITGPEILILTRARWVLEPFVRGFMVLPVSLKVVVSFCLVSHFFWSTRRLTVWLLPRLAWGLLMLGIHASVTFEMFILGLMLFLFFYFTPKGRQY